MTHIVKTLYALYESIDIDISWQPRAFTVVYGGNRESVTGTQSVTLQATLI